MATIQPSPSSSSTSSSGPQNPLQTFMDRKQPLLPRQSTSDVLSFTHIIANRLTPGQSVWEFFSPPPPPLPPSASALVPAPESSMEPIQRPINSLPPLSPTIGIKYSNGPHPLDCGHSPNSPCQSPHLSMATMLSPLSPELPSIAQRFNIDAGRNNTIFDSNDSNNSNSRRQSLQLQTESCSNKEGNEDDKETLCKVHDANLPPSSVTPSSPTPSSSLPAGLMMAGITAVVDGPLGSVKSTAATVVPSSIESSTIPTEIAMVGASETPKLQKRRSFAQSLKNSMLSLTQLLSPTNSSSPTSSPSLSRNSYTNTAAITATNGPCSDPPHYNILVLGSDSAPLASTLYKMSSLLPGTSKIRHYQEISGFFVAHFRSDEPPSSTKQEEEIKDTKNDYKRNDGMIVPAEQEFEGGQDISSGRSSEETLSSQLQHITASLTQSTIAESTYSSSDNSTANSINELEEEREKEEVEVLLSCAEDGAVTLENDICEPNFEGANDVEQTGQEHSRDQQFEHITTTSSSGCSLSMHAFSLDTMWPVPRILAQTFWFPFAHGIIFIVDATRKNDPRAVDHLLNARQFLASLIADPNFKRSDIPVTVFANKAGSDPETCYRLDEIAEILGCEDWDIATATGGGSIGGGTGKSKPRPWCIKSTRTDGEGNGIRESVEWLKTRMGEVWSTP